MFSCFFDIVQRLYISLLNLLTDEQASVCFIYQHICVTRELLNQEKILRIIALIVIFIVVTSWLLFLSDVLVIFSMAAFSWASFHIWKWTLFTWWINGWLTFYIIIFISFWCHCNIHVSYLLICVSYEYSYKSEVSYSRRDYNNFCSHYSNPPRFDSQLLSPISNRWNNEARCY